MQILIRNRATDLDARMHDGTTPLILAARLAVEGMVEELINCHADVNAIDDSGMTITLPYSNTVKHIINYYYIYKLNQKTLNQKKSVQQRS